MLLPDPSIEIINIRGIGYSLVKSAKKRGKGEPINYRITKKSHHFLMRLQSRGDWHIDSSKVNMRNFLREIKLGGIMVNRPGTFAGSYQDLYDAIATPSLSAFINMFNEY